MQTTQFDLKCHDISPIGIMMACETMQDMVSCLAMSTSGGDNSTLLNLLQKILYIYWYTIFCYLSYWKYIPIPRFIRALEFGDAKNVYFTSSEPTLSILLSHFTTYPTSQFLFLHTTH